MMFSLLNCITQPLEGQSGCSTNIQCLVIIEHERDRAVTVRFSYHQKALNTELFYRSKLDKVVAHFVSFLIITERVVRSRRLINNYCFPRQLCPTLMPF